MFDFSSNAKQKEAWLFLDTLWQGLEYLCQQVERVERERAKPDKNFAYVDFSSSPGDAMLCNYFLWYANALYIFIGVFKKTFSPSEDLEREFANLITWRHKVSAHTSWVWPHGERGELKRIEWLVRESGRHASLPLSHAPAGCHLPRRGLKRDCQSTPPLLTHPPRLYEL